jgi:hypothetical protein
MSSSKYGYGNDEWIGRWHVDPHSCANPPLWSAIHSSNSWRTNITIFSKVLFQTRIVLYQSQAARSSKQLGQFALQPYPLLTPLMQFSRTNHPYGDHSRYRIGNDDPPPYFQEYTNAVSSTRPYVTQFGREVSKDSNATGSSRMWYNGFTSPPPGPIYRGTYQPSMQELNAEDFPYFMAPTEMHIHVDPAPAYLANHHFRTNPYQGPVQLVLDNFLVKLQCHNPTLGSTAQLDCGAYDPPGFGGTPPPIGLGACDNEGPPYIVRFSDLSNLRRDAVNPRHSGVPLTAVALFLQY